MTDHLEKVAAHPPNSIERRLIGQLRIWGVGACVYSNMLCDRSSVWNGRYIALMGEHAADLPIFTNCTTCYHATARKAEWSSSDQLHTRTKDMHRFWELARRHQRPATVDATGAGASGAGSSSGGGGNALAVSTARVHTSPGGGRKRRLTPPCRGLVRSRPRP